MRCETKNADSGRGARSGGGAVQEASGRLRALARRAPGPEAVGALAGTRVLTLEGVRQVETLAGGDRVIARLGGALTVQGAVRRFRNARVLRIAADSLGPGKPARDVLVTTEQVLRLRQPGAEGATCVAAGSLLGRDGVALLGSWQVALYDLSFDAPQVLYCDGLEVVFAAPANRVLSTAGS